MATHWCFSQCYLENLGSRLAYIVSDIDHRRPIAISEPKFQNEGGGPVALRISSESENSQVKKEEIQEQIQWLTEAHIITQSATTTSQSVLLPKTKLRQQRSHDIYRVSYRHTLKL